MLLRCPPPHVTVVGAPPLMPSLKVALCFVEFVADVRNSDDSYY